MATRMIDTGLKTVWSAKGDTDSANFVPVTGPINSTMVKNVRVSKYIESNTGKCEVRHGYNMSDDGITWSSTVTELGDWSTTTGWSSQFVGTPFVSRGG